MEHKKSKQRSAAVARKLVASNHNMCNSIPVQFFVLFCQLRKFLPLKTTVKSSRSVTVPLTMSPVDVSPLNSTGQRENNGVNGLSVENKGTALVAIM